MKSDLAFVFPGQGSQKIGMLSELAEHHPVVQATFAEASEVLDYDLWALAQAGTQEQINLTERTQPLLLSASVAIWRLWRALGGPRPAQMAGHSLGEWSALVCAEVIDFADAVKVVRARGAAMQEAVPANVGAMAAVIGLDDEAIRQVCIASVGDGIVEAVNYNAPGQVVIAGTAEAVDRAVKACKVAGAKRALPLPVSAPFHTSLMRPAADAVAPLVEELSFSNPIVPIVHNVTACVEVDGEAIKELMLEQIYKPVPWVSCVLALKSAGITDVVECGPGRVLSGLIKRIAADLSCYTTDSVISMNESLVSV
jgi:[acyl-carrier-protein] S-malonyltransferase